MKSATHSWFGAGGGEVPVDQIGRPRVAGAGIVVADLLAAQRAGPALWRHQPLHGAPGHVVALRAQVQPHLAGTEPGTEPVLRAAAISAVTSASRSARFDGARSRAS